MQPLNPESPNGEFQKLHHVGFVVSQIDSAMHAFVRSVAGTWDGRIFEDPIQKVKVAFLQTSGSDVQIELVEPVADDSPVKAFLLRGGGLHHLCYEVEDCEEALRVIRHRKGLLVKRPAPAIAFEGRRIAWALTAEKLLLEFVEKAKK